MSVPRATATAVLPPLAATNQSLSLSSTAHADELRALRVQQRSDERVTRLNGLVEEFGAFNEKLHASEWAEREAAEARLQACERTIERLQQNTAAEVEARLAVVENVRAGLEAQAAKLESAQTARLVDARRSVEVDIALVDNRLERADVIFEQEKVATQRAIERAHAALLRMLLELRDALGVEIAMRIEREALTASRISDEVFALQELLQGEAGAFQTALGSLRDSHEQARGLLVKSDEAFKHGLMAQLTACQRALKAECEERYAAERQFVATLQDYAGGLVDGLKNVNKRVRDDGAVR